MMKENFESKQREIDDMGLLIDDSFSSQPSLILKIIKLTECYLSYSSFLPVQQTARPAIGAGSPSPLTPATLGPDRTAPPRPPMTPSWRRHTPSPGAIAESPIQEMTSSKPKSNDESKSQRKLREEASRNHLNEWGDTFQPFSRLTAMILIIKLFKSQSHLLSPETPVSREEEFNAIPREEQIELSKLKRCLHSLPNKLSCGQIKPVI